MENSSKEREEQEEITTPEDWREKTVLNASSPYQLVQEKNQHQYKENS